MAISQVTAEKLHDCFKGAIKRPGKRRPVPDMHLCAELAGEINKYRLRDIKRDPLFDLVADALRDARPVSRSLRRIKRYLRQFAKHHRITVAGIPWSIVDVRWAVVDDVISALNAFDNELGPLTRSPSRKDKWSVYAWIFTPHSVETLRRAGWSNPSETSDSGPVTAVLSMLIGAVTGQEPPDQASLGRTLREARRDEPRGLGSRRIRLDDQAQQGPRPERTISAGKTRRKSSSTSSDQSRRKRR